MKTRILALAFLAVNFIYINAQTVPYPDNINGGAYSGIVGKISDTFDVNPNGLVDYEIPITVPSGTGGMTPQLALAYSSSQSDGLLGSGFELTGLSVINRAPSNLHIDGKAGFVNYSNSDKFMLDGQRLILIKTINSNTWEYRTENNSFAQIIASGGTLGTPTTFTVKTKSGLIYEYSSNTAPLTRSSVTAGNVSVFWLLTKVSDTKTNYYTISYSKDDINGEYWPIRIDYTGNTNTQLVPYNSIRIDYTTNSYPQDAYIYGVKVRRSRIITGINIYSGNNRVKYYVMSYQTVNSKRQLTQVTEYASDGTKKNPTRFSWHNSSSYVTSKVDYNTTSYITKADLHVGDFSGDGRADFLVTPKPGANWTGWRLFLSNGSSFSYHSSGSFALAGDIQEVVVGDFNGDGYSDFVVRRKYNGQYYNSDLYLAKVSGSSVTFVFSGCFLTDTREYYIKAAEFNGDGATDIFAYFLKTKECKLIRSVKSGNSIAPLSYTATRYGTVNWDKVETVDFNGDGLTEIMNLHADGYTLLESDGYGTMSQTRTATWPTKEHHLYLGDFNGDGKTDMLLTGWNKDPNAGGWSSWAMNFSKGDGTFDRYDFTKKFNSKEKVIYVGDITGDGKDDFYAVDKAAPTNSLSCVYAYINDGTGKYFSQVSGAYTYGLDKWLYYLGDFNGDGKTDFLCTANFSNVTWTGCQLHLVPESTHNLLASITDGMGAITEVVYKPMSDSSIHTRGTTYAYPLSSFSNAWYLVDKIYSTNGIGGKNTTSYKYKNALMHDSGRGVLGFEYFTQKDEVNNVEIITQFEVNTTQFISAVKSVENKVYGKTVNKIEYTNTLKSYNSSQIFSFIPTYTKELKYEYTSGLLLSTTESTYEHDSYGNVAKHITKVGSDVITNTNTYTNDEINWHLGRLIKAVVNKKNSTEDITLTSNFGYDPINGLLTKEEFEPEDIKIGYTKTYTHDLYGNITESKTVPKDTGQRSHIVKTEYDSSGRFIVRSTDNMNMSTLNTINYDLGVVLSIKDPNNYETQFEYNKFGDLLVAKTGISYEQSAYRWVKGHVDAPTNAVFFKYIETKGIAPVLEFYDILGRTLRTVTTGFSSQKIYVDNTYNTKGQIDKTSEPYFAGQRVYWNRNEYDSAGRISKQACMYFDLLIPYESSVYTFQYNGFETITTDPLGCRTIKKVDIHGNLVESTDAKAGKVNYAYDISGNCIKVVSPRTTAVTTYDKVGNKTRQEDPDLGVTTYTYNAYGELLSKTVNQKATSFQYDPIGRIKKVINPDGEINYYHDSRWKGAVDKITSSNGTSEEYFYDSHGRINKTIEIVDGKNLSTETTYSSINNLQETITYPSGLKVKNEYNSDGYLIAVKNFHTNYTYWTANRKNARGQLESITYGNNLSTQITYNAQKGYITNISTGSIQNWTYAFNTIGNLTDRKNNLRNLAEHFDYDELNRLTRASHNGVLKQEMMYDSAGNLTFKTGIGSQFTYQNGTNRLVSVTGAGYNPKEWDEIRYTVYDKVSYLRSGSNSQSIVYGPLQQRKKTVTIVNGVTETKYYSGSLYEEIIKNGETKQINYIFAEGQSIAIFEKSNVSGEKLLYLLKDHLGTVQALTDESGSLVQELSYDAWGKRRNPENWQYYAEISDANALTPRGFTGHEHLDMFDIVNMDGRMYDPSLGRFLSPDPFVQAPDFTQGLNRYIYCLNNPLSLYDPSGYSWFSKNWKSLLSASVGIAVTIISSGIASGVGGAMIAGALGGAAAGLSGALLNGANFGQVTKSTFTGGFWGAVGGFLANGAGDGEFLERLFKHTFSQTWLEGVRGGNMKHGLIAGAASVAGGYLINKYGSGLNTAGKTAINAVVSGTVSELGGGKFANGAITGAFTMLFNDLMHLKRGDYLEYNGSSLNWYDGNGNLIDSYNATSGLPGYQIASNQNIPDKGPIPEGTYRINLSLDPDRTASVDSATGEILSGNGIQKIPSSYTTRDGRTFTYPGWGTMRAKLNPVSGNMRGRHSFYLHDSHKGYSHGCIEVGGNFFRRLIAYRQSNSSIHTTVKYPSVNTSTYGGTKF